MPCYEKRASRAFYSVAVVLLIHHIWLHGFMIKISGDIELNPGPKQKQGQSLSICHWDLNSTPAHNFQHLELLLGYVSSNKVLLKFYDSLRPFLIQIFDVMTTTCNYQDLT